MPLTRVLKAYESTISILFLPYICPELIFAYWGCKRQQVAVSFLSSPHAPLIPITNTQIPASLPHPVCPTPNTQSIAGTMNADCDQGFASSSNIGGFSGEMLCQGVTSLWVKGKEGAGSLNLVSWQPCTIPTGVFMESLVSVPLYLHPLFTHSVSSSFPNLVSESLKRNLSHYHGIRLRKHRCHWKG